MSKKIQNVEKSRKLLHLQRDYIVKALAGLDEVLAMASDLENMEDPELIESYLKKMDEVESEIDKDYHTACKIEAAIK